MVTQKQGKMALKDIKTSYQENWRHTSGDMRINYAIPTMIDEIKDAGRIIVPPVVEEETGELLRGFRRVTAGKEILDDPKAPQDTVKNLQKIDVIFVSGLSPLDKIKFRYDDGGYKLLMKSEVIASYFKLRKNMVPIETCYMLMYGSIARVTGSTEKISKVEALSGPERASYLKNWFKGTIDQFFEYAFQCGPVVQEQLILTELAREKGSKNLSEDEKARWKFPVGRAEVKALYTAMGEGHEAFVAKLQQLEDIASGKITDTSEDKKPLTKSQIEAAANGASSQRYRKTILQAVLGEDAGLKARELQTKIDSELTALENLQDVCVKSLDSVKKDAKLHAVMLAVSFPTKENVEKVAKLFA